MAGLRWCAFPALIGLYRQPLLKCLGVLTKSISVLQAFYCSHHEKGVKVPTQAHHVPNILGRKTWTDRRKFSIFVSLHAAVSHVTRVSRRFRSSVLIFKDKLPTSVKFQSYTSSSIPFDMRGMSPNSFHGAKVTTSRMEYTNGRGSFQHFSFVFGLIINLFRQFCREMDVCVLSQSLSWPDSN